MIYFKSLSILIKAIGYQTGKSEVPVFAFKLGATQNFYHIVDILTHEITDENEN